jgi:hypothetical protein
MTIFVQSDPLYFDKMTHGKNALNLLLLIAYSGEDLQDCSEENRCMRAIISLTDLFCPWKVSRSPTPVDHGDQRNLQEQIQQ